MTVCTHPKPATEPDADRPPAYEHVTPCQEENDWEQAERTVVIDSPPDLAAVSHAYRQQYPQGPAASSNQAIGSLRNSPGVSADAADLFRAVHRSDPEKAQRLAQATIE